MYHTAGHLVASCVEHAFPQLRAVAGHQWPGEGRVEFEGEIQAVDPQLDALNDELRSCIEGDLTVNVVGHPFVDRAIQIGAFTPIPCGGTHLSSLSSIKFVTISSLKRKSGRLRLSYETSPK